jgi:hypothetical protein
MGKDESYEVLETALVGHSFVCPYCRKKNALPAARTIKDREIECCGHCEKLSTLRQGKGST